MSVVYENDLLTCGKIVTLRVLKETKDELASGDSGETLDDVDFDYLIEIETRNLNNPEAMDMIEKLSDWEE